MDTMISIIVPVYNVEMYLVRCLESIIHQSHSALQIILIDDGSTDGSGKICDLYKEKDERILVIHKKNGGVSSARNEGLRICCGNYVAFVDADDYIQHDYCERLLNASLKYDADVTGCSLIGTDGDKCFPIDELSLDTQEEMQYSISDDSFDFFKWYSINAPFCKLIRKAAIGDLRFDSSLCVGEDLVFFVKLLMQSEKCVSIAQPMYHYLLRPTSAMRTRDFKHLYSEVVAWNTVYDLLNDAWISKKRASEKLMYYAYHFTRKVVSNNELDNHTRKFLSSVFWKNRKQKYVLGNSMKLRILYPLLFICPKFFLKLSGRII